MKKPNPKDYVGRAMEYYRAGAEYNKAQSGKEKRDYQFRLDELTLGNLKKTLGMGSSEGDQEKGQYMQQLKAIQNKYKKAARNKFIKSGLGPMNEGNVKQN